MFSSVKSLLSAAADKPLWKAVLDDDCQDRQVSPEDSMAKMGGLWEAMKASLLEYDPTRRSFSGLSGGQGAQMAALANPICGPFIQEVVGTALKLGEHRACMGCVVAAPTAEACGVLPAVLIPLQRGDQLTDEQMIQCLYAAAGFGQIIATRASVSGAVGGCQAELGSASGMAAAALVHARGGSPEQMAAACAMALQNMMGLVCDPVAGLVEVPCVKRGVMGAVNAASCADMALAGLDGVIPCDEVIDAMAAVGRAMPSSLRGTGGGGLAATPTGQKIAEKR